MLEQIKTDDPTTRFCYLFDSSVGEKKRMDPSNP